MEWFIFALLAPALFGISNIIDKFVLSKYIKNPFSYPVLLGCIYFFFALLIHTFTPVSFFFPYSIFAMLIGIVSISLLLFYAKSMIVDEASRVIIFSNLRPLFVVLLAIVFLNEVLTLVKYIGIFLLVSGTILISYRKLKLKKLSVRPTLKFLLPLPLLMAISDVIEKYLLNYINYWSLYFWASVGTFIFGLTFLSRQSIRKDLFVIIKKTRVISLVFVSELITALALIAFFVALSLGPVSLVSTFTGLQPFFVLVYVVFLSIFLPRILKEEIGKQTILLKFLAVILIFLGTYLMVG